MGRGEASQRQGEKVQPPQAFRAARPTSHSRGGHRRSSAACPARPETQAEMQAEIRMFLLVPLLLAPAPGSSAPKVRRQSDLWGPWGSWGPCSRTCGGGISFRERPCYSQRTDGGSSCVGPVRSHRSCHTESCPTGARDFRAEQCAQFDGQDFQGKRYKWLPYYGAPNKCELNCIPKGENFYYKHREAVVDGTPCEPGKRDVCVEGSCRAVGCDHNLDSSKEEDKCLQCGGDGTTCYPVTGTFDANDLSRGYNQILIIPSGATSIRVEEAAASRNFLAVKSIRGEYYLNGHWTIGGAWALPVASTVLHYERGAEGDLAPERLLARGPTSEPLVIELLSQEPNPGVSYEYHLPLGSPRPGFHWSHGSWSDCSTECGGGHQSRPVFCTTDNEVYPDHMCQPQLRPTDHRPCSTHPCPQTKRWKTGPWSPCSASCGGGSQSRSVYCVLSDGAGVQEATEEAECAGLPGKPPTMRPCNLQRCASWSAEPWGECSVSCGAGIRKRSVTCRGDEGSLLQATACSLEDRPPVSEPCAHEDCPPVSDQAWHVGAWGLCSKSCSSGTRRRQVVCALGPPSRCGSLVQSKPGEVEPCNTQPCHLPPGVPSMQDMHSSPGDPRISLGPQAAPTSDSRGQWWARQEQPSAQGNPTGAQGLHLPAPAPSFQQSPHRQSGLAPHDCRLSPYGCCPDGHTVSLGPQWQGCPGASCQQSRYGCCPDGVSVAEGPHQAGCAASYSSDKTGRRPVSRAVASTAPKAHQPQAQQKEPSECQGSRFGCCYDNVASAAGPLGEGCVGQPGYAYPVRCLLPSAHGSCTDWAARWYFVPSVGQCNRFWYGGCHGNGNNFASEEECVNSCRGRQQEPPRPEPGASGQSTHRDGGGSGPGGQQEAGGHRTGATVQTRPLPSGGLWWRDREPGPGEEGHAQAFGERPLSQELGPSAPGLGGDAGRPAAPSHSSSYRISLAGSEPALVQAALGHLVRLFCQDDTSPEPHARWQKDGRPISSDRHKLQPDGSLVISPLRAEDTGTYSCGSSRPGRDSQKIQLRVTGGDVAVLSEAEPRHFPQTRDPAQGHSPRESSLVGNAGGLGAVSSLQIRPTTRLLLDRNQPRVVDAHPGQRIRLTCRAEGFPPPAIEWQRDGQPLSSPRHQLQPDGSLVISHVALEDGGFYACVAFNGQDRDQRWVQLRVLGELAITELPSTMLVPEGDTARLLCVVTGESVNIRWSRNGLPVRADGHRVYQSPDGTLLIHNLQPRDEGSYTCSAYRGSQAVSRSTEVKVGPPALAAQSRDLSRECMDQPELANCDLILQAQLCGNEYYSSFCCASCSRFQPHARPVWQQG
ncbi:papilin isoform X2 [Prionailurus bengalensis]|uniref:papilin isoform X2 n=1 Tax=Prionailurus bengalensis TaxID=37029 RepID=UPI001CA9E4D9|nr:papilin isoform X2 [Prionailurus bengalensis]